MSQSRPPWPPVASAPLCFRLTATASARAGKRPVEHLSRPEDLADWMVSAGLFDVRPAVSETLLDEARSLREAIYTGACGLAAAGQPAEKDLRHVNRWAARNTAVRVLDAEGARWDIGGAEPARTALAVIATDAVDTLGDRESSRAIKVCAGEQCQAVFLDTSRGHTRRWCSMGTCGNRAKKSAMNARRGL